jgi:UrcA family protein
MFGFASHASTGLRGLLFGVAVLAAAGPALSQPSAAQTLVEHDGQVTAAIPTNDLDLTTDAGRKALHHRVWVTAEMACEQSGAGPVTTAACDREAVRTAAAMERQVIAHATARTYAGAAATPVALTARANGR